MARSALMHQVVKRVINLRDQRHTRYSCFLSVSCVLPPATCPQHCNHPYSRALHSSFYPRHLHVLYTTASQLCFYVTEFPIGRVSRRKKVYFPVLVLIFPLDHELNGFWYNISVLEQWWLTFCSSFLTFNF